MIYHEQFIGLYQSQSAQFSWDCLHHRLLRPTEYGEFYYFSFFWGVILLQLLLNVEDTVTDIQKTIEFTGTDDQNPPKVIELDASVKFILCRSGW